MFWLIGYFANLLVDFQRVIERSYSTTCSRSHGHELTWSSDMKTFGAFNSVQVSHCFLKSATPAPQSSSFLHKSASHYEKVLDVHRQVTTCRVESLQRGTSAGVTRLQEETAWRARIFLHLTRVTVQSNCLYCLVVRLGGGACVERQLNKTCVWEAHGRTMKLRTVGKGQSWSKENRQSVDSENDTFGCKSEKSRLQSDGQDRERMC